LLANAIKFTPKAGVVTITVTRIDSRIEISVSDNGRGITPEFLPYVFERFRQADSSSTRHHGGLGIGLALVRQLVELHGGSVRAESPGLNQGSTFVVSLPVFAGRFDSAVTRTSSASEPAATPAPQTLAGIKVLVIDDDHDSLDVVRRILAGRDAEVQTVTSVEEALEQYTSFRPDVILSDIGMPTHDGYELIHRLRALPGGRSTPAAAMTAMVRPEDRMRALKAGFQTHVSKPIAPAEVVAVVHSLAALRSEHAVERAGRT
ncbi:MAG TPA: ATP-binding protein, partial [Opitutus sp.]|nr:ATP-binding protein [Opitutus sp.]